MKLSDEYRLSQYKDLDILAGNASVHLVRNEATGMICVQNVLQSTGLRCMNI